MPYKLGDLTVYSLGEEGSGTKLKSGEGVQNFQQIKAECLASGKLWEDPDFELSHESIKRFVPDASKLCWKRPKEIRDKCGWFDNDEKLVFSCKEAGDETAISRFDIKQRAVGNCAAMAGISSASLHPDLIKIVIPDDNSFDEGQYCGAFHFRFYRFGRWLDFVIDDRLPCMPDGRTHGVPPSKEGNQLEFWGCLMEKAFSKLSGSFSPFNQHRVLEAVSGSCVANLHWKQPKAFETLEKCWRQGAIGNTGFGERVHGLTPGHAYAVTDAQEIQAEDGSLIQLVRIRNPWGKVEYDGPWSDKSEKWSTVSPSVKEKLVVVDKADGEFWMELKQLLELSECVSLVRLVHEEINSTKECAYNYAKYMGTWKKDADGKLERQFFFEVTKSGGEPADAAFYFASLGKDYNDKNINSPDHKIGTRLKVFKIDSARSNEEPLPGDYFSSKTPIVNIGDKLGGVYWGISATLDPGPYCALLTAEGMDPDFPEFVLRFLWEK